MTPQTFTARATAETETRVNVQLRDFTLTIDEPVALGGSDQEPNPVEFVLAAVMGCMNVVVHLVAKERGVRIRSLEATARGSLAPARFMGRPTQARTGFPEIEVGLDIDRDAPSPGQEEIIHVAGERCPVSDNLSHPTPVRIRLTSGR